MRTANPKKQKRRHSQAGRTALADAARAPAGATANPAEQRHPQSAAQAPRFGECPGGTHGRRSDAAAIALAGPYLAQSTLARRSGRGTSSCQMRKPTMGPRPGASPGCRTPSPLAKHARRLPREARMRTRGASPGSDTTDPTRPLSGSLARNKIKLCGPFSRKERYVRCQWARSTAMLCSSPGSTNIVGPAGSASCGGKSSGMFTSDLPVAGCLGDSRAVLDLLRYITGGETAGTPISRLLRVLRVVGLARCMPTLLDRVLFFLSCLSSFGIVPSARCQRRERRTD